MATWIKRGLLVCAVFVVTWVMFIIYWSGANHMPDGGDVILYLLVLPAGFLLLVWGIHKARVAMAAAAAARAAQAAATPATGTGTPAPAQHPERHWTLAVVATALRAPGATDAATLLEQMQSQKARPELDPELTDSSDFPILSGRIAELEVEDPSEEFFSWQRQHFADQPISHASDEQLRSLALAADVARELGDRLQWHPLLEEFQAAPAHQKEAVGLPTLHLLALLPASWQGSTRLQAAQWLAHLITERGWPAGKITVLPAAAGEPAHPLRHLDRLVATSRDPRSEQPSPYLAASYLAVVIAAQSNLDRDIVQAWEQDKQLLHGNASNGRSPGEAAAGLILADATQAVALGTEDPVLLHRARLGRHDKPVDQARRVDADLLIQLAQSALQDAAVAATAVSLIVTDGDHRGNRTEEIMKLGYAVLPELDLGSQCLKLAAGCGSAGAATVLATLVLAHAATEQSGEPALCVSNDDAHERAAILLTRPSPLTPAAAAAPASPEAATAASTATA